MPNPARPRTEDSRCPAQADSPAVFARLLDYHEMPTAVHFDRFVADLKKWQKDYTNRDAQGYYDRLQRACSWLGKSKKASDPEARFIFLWIALNALYGVRPEILRTEWWKSENRSHPSMGKQQSDDEVPRELEWFLWRICGLDVDQRILRSLIEGHWDDAKMILQTRYLMSNYWGWKWRTENEFERRGDTGERMAKDAIGLVHSREKTYRALCEIVVWRLRTLRNQLLHGCATDTHSKRRDSGESELEAGGRLLGELVWAFLKLMATESGRAMYWPPIPFPRAGSAQHQPLNNSWLPTIRQQKS